MPTVSGSRRYTFEHTEQCNCRYKKAWDDLVAAIKRGKASVASHNMMDNDIIGRVLIGEGIAYSHILDMIEDAERDLQEGEDSNGIPDAPN